MKALYNFHKQEHGQILVIVALAMVALMAMAMLLLDGGALLVNRRSAQNAADAAALAGARVYCGSRDATWEDDVKPAIKQYAEDYNAATVLWDQTKITDENVGVIAGLLKGEVVVTVQFEHGSFFARLFGQEMLTATATAGAGCFNYGASVVLPIAFPCQVPERVSESGVSTASDDCDYAMLDWGYFDDVATGTPVCTPENLETMKSGTDVNCGCGLPDNPLSSGLDISKYPTQAECISKVLTYRHPELIYMVMNEEKYCAKDLEDVDPTNEIVCELFGDGSSSMTGSSRGWLNLSDGNAGTATLEDWILGKTNPPLSTHVWLSFLGGTRANPVFTDLQTRLFDIVYLPVFNYVCDWEPVPGDECYTNAHDGWTDEDGTHAGVDVPDGVECRVISGSPANDFGHIVAYAPFFTTCIRQGSTDLADHIKDKTKDYEYDASGFESDCPGFELAVKVTLEDDDGEIILDDDGNIYYPNMYALEKTNYSFEGFFIDPEYLDDPENVSVGAADLGIYTAQLTR
jgi:hypothetical protein